MAAKKKSPARSPAAKAKTDKKQPLVVSATTAFLEALGRIAGTLTEEPSRIFALFLVAAMFAMWAATGTDVGGATSTVVLSALGACFLLTLVVLWRGERYRVRVRNKTPRSTKAKLLQVLAIALVLSASLATLEKLGVVARAFPSLYPERGALTALQEHFERLDRFLRADPGKRTRPFRAYALTLTPSLRERNLPRGAATLLASTRDDDRRIERVADNYRERYGRIDGAIVEALAIESWRPIERHKNRRTAHVLAVVRYTGKFLPNDLKETALTVESLGTALTDPDSAESETLTRWLRDHFPDGDHSKLRSILLRTRLSHLVAENALDLIDFFDTDDALGAPAEARYRFASEIALYSVRMECDVESDATWQVSEVGKWAVHRIFTRQQPRSIHMTPTQIEGVPYYRQEDPTLCQSAALQMLYEHLKKQTFPGGQHRLRRELDTGGDGTSHTARVRWLSAHLAQYSWAARYIQSFGDVVRQLRQQLQAGVPAVLSTRLTPDGHVIVVTGIRRDDVGRVMVRAHDPLGRFDFHALRYDKRIGVGRDVEYPLEMLFVRNRGWRSAETGDLLVARYVTGLEEWQPSVEKCLKDFMRVEWTKQDWEWMEASK